VRLAFTDKAEADLESIAAYIAQSNPPRAVSFVEELLSACEGVARRPLAFPLAPRFTAIGVRRRVFGNYVIFFRASADVVLILRVLHVSLDHGRLFGPD
jgi:plasmid stabilization system protein ParE